LQTWPVVSTGCVPPGCGVVAEVPWQVPHAAVEFQVGAFAVLPLVKLPWQ
jgi:hypothetical protein